jgi:transcriptional regulator with XRE-family HTH domain
VKPLPKKKALEGIRQRCAAVIRATIAQGGEVSTQLEYAKATGISNNRISLILNGQAYPMTWEIHQICVVSQVSAEFLIMGKKPLKESAQQIILEVKKQIEIWEGKISS